MDRKDFFKRLDGELDAITPPLSETLKAEPIVSASPEREPVPEYKAEPVPAAAGAGGHSGRFFGAARWRVPAIVLACVLLCGLVLGVLFAALPRGGVSVLRLDINPSVGFVLDGSQKVTGVISLNADGDTVLLSEEGFFDSLIGTSAEEAAIAVTDRAAQTGYLDVTDTGSAEGYNEVTLTLTGANASAETASEISSAITEHSRSLGIYLYAEAETVKSDVSEQAERYAEEQALYYERIGEAAALEAYAERRAYDCAEVLLAEALTKYDLYVRIRELNVQIAEACGGSLSLLFDTASYWYWRDREDASEEVAALCAETERTLAQMRLLFGLEWDSYFAFETSYGAYMLTVSEADVAELRVLLEEGIGEENFGGTENLALRLKYYNFVGNDLLQTIFSELFDGVTDTLEELFESISSLVSSEAQALYLRYSALFSLPREAIGEAEYAAFLARIGKQ